MSGNEIESTRTGSHAAGAKPFRLLPTLLWMAIALLSGCTAEPDQRLAHIDAIMEQHPDSALIVLDTLSLRDNATEYDRAYRDLLLSHALYKNYIDTDNDSLIGRSARYFLDNAHPHEAARALFLMGMVQLNSNRLSEAAVTFSKGMHTAAEAQCHLWEGQCARGLFILYGKLLNSSAQLKYADREFKAFSKSADEVWTGWGKLDLATAYSNNGQYDLAYTLAKELASDAGAKNDSTLQGEALTVAATSCIQLGRYSEATDNYIAAYEANPEVLSDNDVSNLIIAFNKADTSRMPAATKALADSIRLNNHNLTTFETYEEQGNYEEAYKDLSSYMNLQDSVIRVIMQNGVSKSLIEYEEAQQLINAEKRRTERLAWVVAILSLIIVGASIAFLLWRKARLNEKLRDDAIMSLDSLHDDFADIVRKNKELSDSFSTTVMEKYEKINSFCDEYYEKQASPKHHARLEKEMGKIVGEFNDDDYIADLERDINRWTDGLYLSFKSDFSEAGKDLHRLYMYLLLGFSSRTIAVILNIEMSAVYNRKSRLKKKIKDSDTPRKESYLNAIK